MNKELERLAMTCTFEVIEKLIYDTCHRFQEKYPYYEQDIEELISEANEIFLTVYKTYDPTRASLTTWTRFKIFHGLLENMRKKYDDPYYITRIGFDMET